MIGSYGISELFNSAAKRIDRVAVHGQTGTGHNSRGAPSKILSVVGARPNFMKIAPIVDALKKFPDLQHCLVHSGQHYDELLSGSFSPNSVCRGLTSTFKSVLEATPSKPPKS